MMLLLEYMRLYAFDYACGVLWCALPVLDNGLLQCLRCPSTFAGVGCSGRWRGTVVAIKVVEHEPPSDSSASLEEQAVEREALLASNLSHPNVIATFKICTMHAGAAHTLQALLLPPSQARASSAQPNLAPYVEGAEARAYARQSPLKLPSKLEPSPFDVTRTAEERQEPDLAHEQEQCGSGAPAHAAVARPVANTGRGVIVDVPHADVTVAAAMSKEDSAEEAGGHAPVLLLRQACRRARQELLEEQGSGVDPGGGGPEDALLNREGAGARAAAAEDSHQERCA